MQHFNIFELSSLDSGGEAEQRQFNDYHIKRQALIYPFEPCEEQVDCIRRLLHSKEYSIPVGKTSFGKA